MENHSVDLVQLEIQGWDVVLQTNWLAKQKVTLDCENKLTTFSAIEEEGIELKEKSFLTYLGEREPHSC